MGYTVRVEPTGPQVTTFHVGVMDGDRIVRPGTDADDEPPMPVPSDDSGTEGVCPDVQDLSVLFENGLL